MPFKRLFTQGSNDPYGLIHFRQPEAMGDGFDAALEHPDDWSPASVEILAAEAASLPSPKKPMEENTVPSWLWRRSRAASVGRKESSVRHIFDRVAGAAAYRGWKLNVFNNEDEARIFFDEARYLLAQRMIGFEPKRIATLGLDWAYGAATNFANEETAEPVSTAVSNAMIDAVVSGRRDRGILNAWQKLIAARNRAGSLHVHFSDTEAQWEAPAAAPLGLRIDLMCFRHNDGSVNIEALRHAVRITLLIADLNDAAPDLAVGFSNLAPLLMALALPYDSEAGRATAAAIAALVTAEAYLVSVELAALRGSSSHFVANREACLRALRNHRRAAYGERNDYEKISVTPLPLALASCPDLMLTAEARSAWDRVLENAQTHGLRYTQLTGLLASPSLTLFMESEADGIEPMRSLKIAASEGEGAASLHPSVAEAMARLGYDAKRQKALAQHVIGAATLEKAPGINHASLRARGFTADALEKLEAYLPQASDLRRAATPWVLGVEFCRKVLKIPAAKIDDMRFDLLSHLGFKAEDIAAANLWCYGRDGMEGAEGLRPNHAAVFAVAASLPAEAPIRMAASVQGLVSGEAALRLRLPFGMPAERFEKLLLDAWRRGVKSLEVSFDPGHAVQKTATTAIRRKTARGVTSADLHAGAPHLPKKRLKTSASRSPTSPRRSGTRGVSRAH